MRKYNNKTKRTIIIILILFAVFIAIFSLFLKKSTEIAKSSYTITRGSILFDGDDNMITTNDESNIRLKWGGNYYLTYNEENYNLGKHSVVYNSNNGDITLYGKYYEVKKDGKVNVIKNENKIKSSVSSKFYKLADRKYLIIDRTIQSTNSSLVTSNYLIIKLDKSGNATLLNDKVSLKTITPTVIQTSAYSFDIANEKINFGKEDIDLKKIIGSTNEYDKDKYDLNAEATEDADETNVGTGTGTGNGSGNGNENSTGNGNGTVNGNTNEGNSNNITGGTTQNSNTTYNNNYDSGISDETVDEIIKATKNTSVIRVIPGINDIKVDYVVYDPDNEYKSVYVEVENTATLQKNIVYLSKTNTNIVISNLTPNVYYNLTFRYTYQEGGYTKEYTFDKFGTYTNIPEITLTATKMINNKLYYKISLDKNYTITGGTVILLANGSQISSDSIDAIGNVNEISGNNNYFAIIPKDINRQQENIFTIKLKSLSFNTYTIEPDITYKFRY